MKAYKNNELFKVYVLVPLMPGFEGDVTDSKNAVVL